MDLTPRKLMIERILSSQLRINMVSGSMTTAINAVVMVVAYPVYLHFLGYEKYGVWLVLATVLTFAQLGNLGMGPAVMKLVAEEYGRGDIEGIQRYVMTALALLCLSGTVVLIVVLVLKTQIIALFRLSGDNAKMVSWLLPYIGVLSIYVFVVQVFEATLSGLGRMDLTNYIQSLGRGINVAAAGLLLFTGFGVKSLLIGSILSYLFIHIANLVCVWRIAPIRFLQIDNLDTHRCKRLLHFGGAVFGGSLISMLFSPFNKLMLSRYAGVSTIPVYEIAFTGSMQIRALFEAGLRALMPEVSRIGATMTNYARDRISQIYRRAMKLIFLFGVPVYAVLVVFAPVLLKVWFGDRLVVDLPGAFRIMLIGSFLSLLGVPAYYTLMGMDQVRFCFGSYVISSVVNVIIVVTIVASSGTLAVQNVACAVLLGISVSTIYLIWQLHRSYVLFPPGTAHSSVQPPI